ncbi:response regulator transcription factor [Saprospiraceae bacterium]|nr:response regulator transcription factor [Saprospiraceae bacterium]
MIKIIIVDDESLFIQGLKMIFSQNERIEVIATASNGQQLIDLLVVDKIIPDIVLLDLSMPEKDGVDTYLELTRMGIAPKTIILSSHYNDGIIIKLLDEGVSAFLAKNEDPDEVMNTIIQVYERGFHINDYIVRLIRNRRLLASKKQLHSKLSGRELEILTLICQELTNKEIAEQLFISSRTVEGHRNRILEKTQSKNTVGIVLYAIEHCLFDVQVDKYQ